MRGFAEGAGVDLSEIRRSSELAKAIETRDTERLRLEVDGRRRTAIRQAVVAGIFAILASLATIGATALTRADPAPPDPPCAIAKIDGYQRLLEGEVISEEMFELHDEGYAIVKVAEVPKELEDQMRTAVVQCPANAISITEDDG